MSVILILRSVNCHIYRDVRHIKNFLAISTFTYFSVLAFILQLENVSTVLLATKQMSLRKQSSWP